MTDRRLRLSSATTATLNVGCLIVLLCPLGARAADFPSKGDFRITYTAVNSSPTKPVPIGDN